MRDIFCILVLCMTSSVIAAEPQTAWRIEFDSADEIGGVHYVVRDGKDTDDGMVFNVADGVLTFGAEVDDNAAGGDHGVLAWGESMPWGFWRWRSSPFEKIDALKFPIVEFRARKAPGFDSSGRLVPTFDTDSGCKLTDLGFSLKDEWETYSFPLSSLSSVPGATIPRDVRGMAFWVACGKKPSGLQIDWIRVRAFTPEEKAEDDAIVGVLGSYQTPAWKQPFFVYGPYGPSILGIARQGGFEGAYGNMTRAHMNYLMCPHDISYYRYQGREGKTTQDENVSDFLDVNRQAVQAATDAGMTMSLDVRGFAKDFDEHGLDYIRPGVQMVADAFRNNQIVLGYTVTDEPKAGGLVGVVAVKKLFEEADPAKLCAFALNDPYWAPDFDPYTTVLAADRYPIKLGQRNPEAVAGVLDTYLAASKKPLWFIVQAIGQKDWWPQKKGNYVTPTDAEFLRMSFMALARGAKGLVFFDWYHRPWKTVVDRYGNPEPLYDTVKSLGGRLAAVGSILLRARYDAEKSPLKVGKEAQPFDIFALELIEPTGILYVACNTDLERSCALDVEVPMPSDNNVVVNLESLRVTSGTRLQSEEVKPGDGRFFGVVAPQDAERLRAEVLANRKREAERVARPDKVIAERWGDASGEMKKINTDLDVCAVKLGDIEKKVSAGVEVPKAGLESQWNRSMSLAQTYDDLRSRWIAGDWDGTADEARALKDDVTKLDQEIRTKEASK